MNGEQLAASRSSCFGNGDFSPAAEIIVTGGHYFGDKLCKGIAVQLVGSDIVGAAGTEKPLPCKYGGNAL